MATKKAVKVDTPNLYDSHGFLPQTESAYTSLAIVKVENADRLWLIRQTDIVDGVVVSTSDSKPLLKRDALIRLSNAISQFGGR